MIPVPTLRRESRVGRPIERAVRGSRVIELRSVFSPFSLVAFLFVPILLLYVVTSEAVFATEFGSRKALTLTGVAFFVLALLCFAAGARWGTALGARRAERRSDDVGPARYQRRSLAVLLEAALVASIGAYIVWFALGIARAGGVMPLLEIWRDNPHRIKSEILTTIPGLTTMTQFAVAAIPLAIAYRMIRKGTAIRTMVVVVLALAAIRAVLFNERLAVIELLVPIVFLLLAPRRVTVPKVAIYAAVLLVAAMSFFAVTEMRRTYVYTNDFSAARSATRFFGYYVTSVNNGVAVIDSYPARTPFYSSGALFWQFPGVKALEIGDLPAVGTLSLRYADLFGVEPEGFWPRAFAARGLDYEFNVFTAPGYLAADFGWAGLLAVLLVGVASGYLYRRGASSPFHNALYAVWLVGLFEFMRILYATNTRVFPAYLVFAAAFLVLHRRAPELQPRLSRVPARPVA